MNDVVVVPFSESSMVSILSAPPPPPLILAVHRMMAILFLVIFFIAAMERRSLVASLQFLLESASRFGLSDEEEHLRAELQQLGLPKEHAGALARVHTEAGPSIRRRLLDSSLMGNE